MTSCVLIAHNLRSTHNVGSLLRTAEGLSLERVYLTGYTPYPREQDDSRLPHISTKLHEQIHKTALDAEILVDWKHEDDVELLIQRMQADGYTVAGLEQSPKSVSLPDFSPPDKLAIIVGREVEGVEPAVLKLCNVVIEIPMKGQKESFNVVQAAAMALYHCVYLKG